MFSNRKMFFLFVAAMVLAGAYPLDRLLTRPGRTEYARLERDLRTVRDELLRYQYEHGDIPKDLELVIPSYLRREQLYDGEDPRYNYSYEARRIATCSGLRVFGLFPRTLPPISYDLPTAVSTRASEEVKIPIQVSGGIRSFIQPHGPERRPAPSGAYVFEAEHYSATNYGWEVKPDPMAGGGAYIHSKEGIANGPGQIYSRIFDFYNLKESEEYNYLKYHFHIPEAGNYYVFGRFWTTSSHCSNTVYVGLDEDWSDAKGERDFSAKLVMQNRSPFQWKWTQAGEHAVYFTKGDHFLNLFLHEDGVRLDQIMLCRQQASGSQVYEPNLKVGQGTAFSTKRARALNMTIDLKSAVFSKSMPPKANVFLRRFKPLTGDATMTVSLKGADLTLEEYTVRLDDMGELGYLPVDFSVIDFAALERREYLLSVRLSQGKDVLAQAQIPIMHHLKWEISSPMRYLPDLENGPLDGNLESASMSWEPMKDRSWTHFGVIDFGLQTINNSLQAPTMKTIYAKTRIFVPESGEYLLKLQADDQMFLWIDGEFVYFHPIKAPVTRSAKRLKVSLKKGEHDLRIRVNQRQMDGYGDGRWQAFLRFRSVDDDLCGIRWAPPK